MIFLRVGVFVDTRSVGPAHRQKEIPIVNRFDTRLERARSDRENQEQTKPDAKADIAGGRDWAAGTSGAGGRTDVLAAPRKRRD